MLFAITCEFLKNSRRPLVKSWACSYCNLISNHQECKSQKWKPSNSIKWITCWQKNYHTAVCGTWRDHYVPRHALPSRSWNPRGVHFWEKFLRFLPLLVFAIIQLQSHHMLPFSISDNFWDLASVCLCWKCHFVVGLNA